MPGEVFTTDIAPVPLAQHSVGEYMTLFVLRLRNGNCVVVAAGDDAGARRRAKDLRADVQIVTVRELESFAAQFLLTDDGELKSILLDEQTLADLRAHEYPILNSARTQSYANFNSSETDSKAEPVLYDALARKCRYPDRRVQDVINDVIGWFAEAEFATQQLRILADLETRLPAA